MKYQICTEGTESSCRHMSGNKWGKITIKKNARNDTMSRNIFEDMPLSVTCSPLLLPLNPLMHPCFYFKGRKGDDSGILVEELLMGLRDKLGRLERGVSGIEV